MANSNQKNANSLIFQFLTCFLKLKKDSQISSLNIITSLKIFTKTIDENRIVGGRHDLGSALGSLDIRKILREIKNLFPVKEKEVEFIILPTAILAFGVVIKKVFLKSSEDESEISEFDEISNSFLNLFRKTKKDPKMAKNAIKKTLKPADPFSFVEVLRRRKILRFVSLLDLVQEQFDKIKYQDWIKVCFVYIIIKGGNDWIRQKFNNNDLKKETKFDSNGYVQKLKNYSLPPLLFLSIILLIKNRSQISNLLRFRGGQEAQEIGKKVVKKIGKFVTSSVLNKHPANCFEPTIAEILAQIADENVVRLLAMLAENQKILVNIQETITDNISARPDRMKSIIDNAPDLSSIGKEQLTEYLNDLTHKNEIAEQVKNASPTKLFFEKLKRKTSIIAKYLYEYLKPFGFLVQNPKKLYDDLCNVSNRIGLTAMLLVISDVSPDILRSWIEQIPHIFADPRVAGNFYLWLKIVFNNPSDMGLKITAVILMQFAYASGCIYYGIPFERKQIDPGFLLLASIYAPEIIKKK